MKFRIVLMAAGFSRRFGGNKLLAEIEGRPVYRYALDKLKALSEREDVDGAVVVTQYEEIASAADEMGLDMVFNHAAIEGIASSLRAGIRFFKEEKDRAYVFMVCDQPHMRIETLSSLLDFYKKTDKGIVCVADPSGIPGNPVIFHERYYGELAALTGDKGGSRIFKKHPEDLGKFTVDPAELKDIDVREDL